MQESKRTVEIGGPKKVANIHTPQEAHRRIMQLFSEYRWTKDRNRLEEIQAIVDRIGKTFEVKVAQRDGIPGTVRFVPRKAGVLI